MNQTSKGSAPGFAKHPGYAMQLTPIDKTVRVSLGDTLIAESKAAIEFTEGRYPPRYYLPMSDVRAQTLTPSTHTTHCPFKGDASYWTVSAAGQSIENGAWAYVEPYDECLAVAGYVSFYGEKMHITVTQTHDRGGLWLAKARGRGQRIGSSDKVTERHALVIRMEEGIRPEDAN